jgi:hypothetical protein
MERDVKTFVVTTAQKGAQPNWNFLTGLERLCKERDGNLMIAPTNGEKTTSRRGKDEDDKERITFRDWINARKNVSLIFDDEKYEVPIAAKEKLNNVIYVMNYPVKAQQMIPLTSWDRHVKLDKSAIIPSPKLMMLPQANSKQSLPKILMSTGAVTEPNYKTNSWGTHAYLDHDFGAILVEVVDSNNYHFRQLVANNAGVVYDMGQRFDGKTKSAKEDAELMVLGDIHSSETDNESWKATKKMLKQFKPEYVMVHDLFSGICVNPFEQGNETKRARLAVSGRDSLFKELEGCGKMLTELMDTLQQGAQVVVVRSNHDQFLDRYISAGDFRMSSGKNLPLLHRLAADLQETPSEDLVGGALRLGIENYAYHLIDGVRWLHSDEDFKKRGWQFGDHGHLGPNGTRGSIRNQEKYLGKSVCGHSHSPGIFRDAWRVGTLSKLDLGYNKGTSNWMHTNFVFYRNGQGQLINILDGKYKG